MKVYKISWIFFLYFNGKPAFAFSYERTMNSLRLCVFGIVLNIGMPWKRINEIIDTNFYIDGQYLSAPEWIEYLNQGTLKHKFSFRMPKKKYII